MKREDDLLRLAFGELSDAAARAVEASANASEKAEIDAFRVLHDGLRHLPSPPPDNLSSERLRAAILDGELKKRRADSGFSWAWTPFALAALAAVVFVARPKAPQGAPVVAMNDQPLERNLPNFSFKPLAKARLLPPTTTPPVVDDNKVAAALQVPSAPGARHRRRRLHRETPDTVLPAPYGPEEPELSGRNLALVVKPQTVASPPSAVVPATFEALPPTSKEDTVVMVSSGRDRSTGAPAATEVEAANVVVGG